MKYTQPNISHPNQYASETPFFPRVNTYPAHNSIQRAGKDGEPTSPVKTEVEVVAEHNLKKKETKIKGTTTRSVEEKVNEAVTTSVKEKTGGESVETTTAVKASTPKVKAGKTGASAAASASVTATDTMDPSVPDSAAVAVKVSGQWVPFSNRTFRLETGTALSLSSTDGPKFTADGKMLFLPNGYLRPEIATEFIASKKGVSGEAKVGLQYDISKQFSLRAGVGVGYSQKDGASISGGGGLIIKF